MIVKAITFRDFAGDVESRSKKNKRQFEAQLQSQLLKSQSRLQLLLTHSVEAGKSTVRINPLEYRAGTQDYLDTQRARSQEAACRSTARTFWLSRTTYKYPLRK